MFAAKQVILIFLFSGQSFLFAQKVTLTIEIVNIHTFRGQILAALFDNENEFLQRPVAHTRCEVTAAKSTYIQFNDLKPGRYAVSLFHDQNRNGKLDKVLGIPMEAFGFSNDAMGKFGPPDYRDCLLTIDRDRKVTVQLKRLR